MQKVNLKEMATAKVEEVAATVLKDKSFMLSLKEDEPSDLKCMGFMNVDGQKRGIKCGLLDGACPLEFDDSICKFVN